MRGRTTTPNSTVLHISDTQFGPAHQFDDHDGSSARHLLRDLGQLLQTGVPPINLIIISGDLTDRGLRSEFNQARAFIDELCGQTGLNHNRVIVVPGNHDVNLDLSSSYFAECRAEEIEPKLPYARKWRHFQQFVAGLHGEAAFTEEQPYRVHRFDDLGVAVAALNSTMRESHLTEDRYGWCGTEQLRWASEQLSELESTGLIRLAVVHHNVHRQAIAGNENLNDAASLTDILGPHLELVLHGHPQDTTPRRLTASDTLVLATGSTASSVDWLPDAVPHRYQILQIQPGSVTRWARWWDRDAVSWTADPQLRSNGGPPDSRGSVMIPFATRLTTEPTETDQQKDADRQGNVAVVRTFLSEVEHVTRVDVGEGCLLERRSKDSLDYLIVVRPAAPLRCIGVVDGRLEHRVLDRFDDLVFAPLKDRNAEFVLVHHGPQLPELRLIARDRGIRVKTWAEYNNLLDLSAYRVWLHKDLRNDPLYPQDLYLTQRFQDIDRWGAVTGGIQDDLHTRIYDDLLEEDQRFVLVLGEAGFGKSFLVRRLAYRMLKNDRASITPVVIYLRDRDKRQSISEMVSNVLIPSRSSFNADRFQHSLEAGMIALLIDGYDEFAVRVGYLNAATQLSTFIEATQGRAKVLLTTRPNHFRSADQATSALFEKLRNVHSGQVHQLEPFDEGQQRGFLVKWFEVHRDATGGDSQTHANRWMKALSRVDNLPELARTPRMLTFMVQDLTLSEIEHAAQKSKATAADLYQRLVTRWLQGEASKVDPQDERNVSPERRQHLLEEIAFHLWRIGERDVTEQELQNVARRELDLPQAELTVDQAAQLIGGRTLLQAGNHRWKFAHQSVWEFLLASYLAGKLRAGTDLQQLGEAELTKLTVRFLRDLAPEAGTAWLRTIAEGTR